MGGTKLWLVSCLGYEPRLAQSPNCKCATFVRRLGEAAAPWAGEWGPCPDFAWYTLAFALQLRKNQGKNLSHGEWNCIFTLRYILMACTRKTTFLDRLNRPGRIRLAVHAAPVINAYQVTVGKSERKRPLRTPRLIYDDTIRIYLKRIRWADVD